MITVKGRIRFKEYVFLMYRLIYKKPLMILVLCAGLLMLAWILAGNFDLMDLPPPPAMPYVACTFILLIQPLLIFFTIKRSFDSNHLIHEPHEITFTRKEIKIRGNSFYTEYFWATTHKVEELKEWFLVYQNYLSATLIHKRYFNKEELREFKDLLRSIHDLDLNLKDEN